MIKNLFSECTITRNIVNYVQFYFKNVCLKIMLFITFIVCFFFFDPVLNTLPAYTGNFPEAPKNDKYLSNVVKTVLNTFIENNYESVPKNDRYLPEMVKTTSDFITRFHKKFEDDSFHTISESYSNSISEEMPDPTTINTFESVSLEGDDQDEHNKKENETTPRNKNNENTIPSMDLNIPIKNRRQRANCSTYNYIGSPRIEIVNETILVNILKPDSNISNRTIAAPCTIMIVFSYSCPFSAMAAPHFNALPRAFPQIKMVAINSVLHQSFNSQYGVVGVPTMILFHNGVPVAKLNRSDYVLSEFAKFITEFTGIIANEKMFVASIDFGGPLKVVPTQETDYHLILCWMVILLWISSRLYARSL